MTIELMKQWLAALERAVHELRGITATQDMTEAITSMRQAIEQAQKKSAHESELMMNDHNYRQKFLEKQEPKPCQTCEALARTVMMDQTGRDA